MLRSVFACAMLRNEFRRSGGSSTVLRGAPPSVEAVGLKVYLAVGACGTGGGDGVAVVAGIGLDPAESIDFRGTGGANWSCLGVLLSRACFAGRAGGGPETLGLL